MRLKLANTQRKTNKKKVLLTPQQGYSQVAHNNKNINS